MAMADEDAAWFAPKRHGFGFRPVRWQGWLSTAAYVGLFVGLERIGLWPPMLRWGLMAIATVGYLVMAVQHMRGGLGWRWGDDR
jgi:hypothetical protein